MLTIRLDSTRIVTDLLPFTRSVYGFSRSMRHLEIFHSKFQRRGWKCWQFDSIRLELSQIYCPVVEPSIALVDPWDTQRNFSELRKMGCRNQTDILPCSRRDILKLGAQTRSNMIAYLFCSSIVIIINNLTTHLTFNGNATKFSHKKTKSEMYVYSNSEGES